MDNLKNISLSPLFSGLTDLQIDRFRRVVSIFDYSSGELIIREGERGDSIVILLDGTVEVVRALTLITNRERLDNREKTFTLIDSKNLPFLGEMAFYCDNYMRSATVRARTDVTAALLTRDAFLGICETDYETGYRVLNNIAIKLAATVQEQNMNVLKLTTAFSLILEK